MIRKLVERYYRWKFRKQDPDVCCCGATYNPRGGCDNHGFVSRLDWTVECAVASATTWEGWARRLVRKLHRNRPADFVVGSKEDPYLLRWWVIPRNRFFNVYLHCFERSDDDRALHDHPYLFNCSLLLLGQYREHHAEPRDLVGGEFGPWADPHVTDRKAPAVVPRWGRAPHRIELTDGTCWTLFITGPRVREWGFYCPQGWRPWQKFTAQGKPGEIGKGCEE